MYLHQWASKNKKLGEKGKYKKQKQNTNIGGLGMLNFLFSSTNYNYEHISSNMPYLFDEINF